jgi:holo-[acyl-carrier protein] synthase
MIVGLGIDLVQVEKLGQSLLTEGFVERVFTPGEAAASRTVKNSSQAFAGKFAAKEACMKALGAGLRQAVWFTDIEVLDEPSGAPRLILSERLQALKLIPAGAVMHVSISHTGEYAAAVVIIENQEKTPGS